MSAVIVLILRILLVVFLYTFLTTSLYVMWREIIFSAKTGERQKIPVIRFEKDDPGQSITFAQPEIIIGRDIQNDFEINDETVSGTHARIFYKNNQWMIEDLHSTNGTFINEERIFTSSVLMSRDIVGCGVQHFSVIFEENGLSPKI